MVVLKELLFNIFYLEQVWVVLKELIFAVYTLAPCGDLKITDF